MTVNYELKFELTKEEKKTLKDAFDIFDDILFSLVALRDTNRLSTFDTISIDNNFYRIYDMCNNIEKDELLPKIQNGDQTDDI